MRKVLLGFAFLALLHLSHAFPLELIRIGELDPRTLQVRPHLRVDLDDDGNPDLVFSTYTSAVTSINVWYGQRDDKYDLTALKRLPFSVGDNSFFMFLDVQAADFGAHLSRPPGHNDGLVDLVYTWGRVIYVSRNLGSRAFSTPFELFGAQSGTVEAIFPCDVNNDGQLDLFVRSFTSFFHGYYSALNLLNAAANTFVPFTDVSGLRCHRALNGTNYILSQLNTDPHVLFNGATPVYSFPLNIPKTSIFLNLTTSEPIIAQNFAIDGSSSTVVYRLDGTNVSRPTSLVPSANFLGDPETFYPYNDDGDFLNIARFNGFFSVLAAKGDLTRNEPILFDTAGFNPVVSVLNRSPNEPEAIIVAKTKLRDGHYQIFMYGPMLRPSIQPAWLGLTASADITIHGKNIAQAQSVRVMWRVSEGSCDISALTSATNGCPAMSRNGDNITCAIPAITGQDCVVQARVVANYSATQLERMSSWENQLVLGTLDFRPLSSAPTMAARNGTRLFFRYRNPPASFVALGKTIQLTSDCSGPLLPLCEGTYRVEAEGFSCDFGSGLAWANPTDICSITATFLEAGNPVGSPGIVVRLTRVVPISFTTYFEIPPSPNALGTIEMPLSITVDPDFISVAPTTSDPFSSWRIVVEESVIDAPLNLYGPFLYSSEIAFNVEVAPGLLPKFQLVSKDGLYESDFVAPPSYIEPLSVAQVRIIPETVTVVETLLVEVLITSDWRTLQFDTASLNISFVGLSMLPALAVPSQCADVANQIRTGPIVFGYIAIRCRTPYFSAAVHVQVNIQAGQTSWTANTFALNPGLPYHPEGLAAVRAINDDQRSEYPIVQIRYRYTTKGRTTNDFDIGTKCTSTGSATVQYRTTFNFTCYSWLGDGTIHWVTITQSCLPAEFSRKNLDGCTIYIRPTTVPVSPWIELQTVAAVPVPSSSTKDYLFSEGLTPFIVNITGESLGYVGEEALTKLTFQNAQRSTSYVCGEDDRSTIVLSRDGGSIICNITDFPFRNDLRPFTATVQRFLRDFIDVTLGNLTVQPFFRTVGPRFINVAEVSDVAPAILTATGDFIQTTGTVQGTANGILMKVRFAGVGCANISEAIEFAGSVVEIDGRDPLVYNIAIPSEIFHRQNIDGCTLYLNYTKHVGLSVELPFSLVLGGQLQLNSNAQTTYIESNRTVAITGAFLPRSTETLSYVLNSTTSDTCSSLAAQVTVSISELFVSNSTHLTLQFGQMSSELDGCGLELSLERGINATAFIGYVVNAPSLNSPASRDIIVANPQEVFTLTGNTFPLSSENPAVLVTFEDGVSVCRNQTALEATITSLTPTEINFTIPFDASRDSCRISVTVSRFGIRSNVALLGTVYYAPTLTEQMVLVRLNATNIPIALSGSSLPRSSAETPLAELSTNCSVDLSALSVNAAFVSFSADGASAHLSLNVPAVSAALLDNCQVIVLVSRLNGALSSSPTVTGRLVSAPQLTTPQTRNFVSSETFSVVFDGQSMPVFGDEFAVEVTSTCSNYLATATSTAVIESSRNLTATFAALPVNLDSCTLSGSVSRFGMVATTVLGTVISRPVVATGNTQLTADSAASIVISGQYFPRTGDAFSVVLNTSCSAFPSLVCGSPSIVTSGSSASCSVAVPLAIDCDVTAIVTREGLVSSSATVGRIVRPVFAPTSKTLTLIIKLDGATAPSPAIIQQVCATVGTAFNPPLVPGINITCSLQTKRAIEEIFNLAAQILGESAITSAETQLSSPQFLTSMTNAVSNSISGSGYTSQPITVDAPAPTTPPSTANTPSASPTSQTTQPTSTPGSGGAVADGSAGLAGGAIAGIVIAVVLAAAVAVFVVFLLMRRKDTGKSGNKAENTTAMKAISTTAAAKIAREESGSSSSQQESSEDSYSSGEKEEEDEEEESDEASSEEASETVSSEDEEDQVSEDSGVGSSEENSDNDSDGLQEESSDEASSSDASSQSSAENSSEEASESSS